MNKYKIFHKVRIETSIRIRIGESNDFIEVDRGAIGEIVDFDSSNKYTVRIKLPIGPGTHYYTRMIFPECGLSLYEGK